MAKATRILFIVGLTAAIGAELQANVYEGPTQCDEADRAKVGDHLGMHYTGTIDGSSQTGEPGKEFDSSRGRDQVLHVTIGVGELIQGWDEGILGLCRGAKAVLVVPSEMGYGASGVGDAIPGGATLRFDVEVVSVTPPPPLPNLFDELDADENGVLTPEEIRVHFRKEGPDAELPPDLMEREDGNGDGVVSREEFGGPRMPWEMCLEMLHPHREAEPTTLGLAVQWICQRPRDLEDEGQVEDEGQIEDEGQVEDEGQIEEGQVEDEGQGNEHRDEL